MLKFNQVLFQSCSFQGHFCPFDLCSTKLHLHPCIHILFFHRSANNFGIHILNLFLIRWQLLQHLELRLVEVGEARWVWTSGADMFIWNILCQYFYMKLLYIEVSEVRWVRTSGGEGCKWRSHCAPGLSGPLFPPHHPFSLHPVDQSLKKII